MTFKHCAKFWLIFKAFQVPVLTDFQLWLIFKAFQVLCLALTDSQGFSGTVPSSNFQALDKGRASKTQGLVSTLQGPCAEHPTWQHPLSLTCRLGSVFPAVVMMTRCSGARPPAAAAEVTVPLGEMLTETWRPDSFWMKFASSWIWPNCDNFILATHLNQQGLDNTKGVVTHDTVTPNLIPATSCVHQLQVSQRQRFAGFHMQRGRWKDLGLALDQLGDIHTHSTLAQGDRKMTDQLQHHHAHQHWPTTYQKVH